MTRLRTASGKTQASLDYKLGAHRGAGRVWLEGHHVAAAGFTPGVRYSVATTDTQVVLDLDAQGPRKVSHKGERPVLDLRAFSAALGTVDRVHVTFAPGSIRIAMHPNDQDALGRVARLNARLAAGRPLQLGSVCHGGGVAANALLRGMGGQLAFAVEQDADYLAQAMAHNPSWTDQTVSVLCDLGDVVTSELPQVDVLEAGLPCISASRAGRSKKALAKPEDDWATADLAHHFLRVIEATQPAVIVLENVPEYATSSSANLIRRALDRLGYQVQEHVLDGAEWSLEARRRWVLVAATRGVSLDLELVPQGRPETLGEVLDTRVDASRWGQYKHLAAKQTRDAARGSKFTQRVLTPAATSVPTLRRGYQKAGSTDPRLAHPTRAGWSRLLTPAEHARIKGIPAELVTGLADTTAHEILGQSVIAPSFVALGAAIAASVR